MTGVVPACRSLDTVSLFTQDLSDARLISSVMYEFDRNDPFGRKMCKTGIVKDKFIFGVPYPGQLEFFGDKEYQGLFNKAVSKLSESGGKAEQIDFSPFLDAAKLLYEGPWVAERYLAVQSLLEQHPDALLPVTRQIIEQGENFSAMDAFTASYKLQELKQKTEMLLDNIDFMVTPTAGTIYRITEIEQQPIIFNSNLGYYTNFMNLLDFSAIAVPAGQRTDGLPFGITLFSKAFFDFELLAYAGRFLTEEISVVDAEKINTPADINFKLVVCGAHMSEMPLNSQLLERHATLITQTKTAACYRLFDLNDGTNRPGLVKVEHGGAAIEVEVWSLPTGRLADFIDLISSPLAIGSIELMDNSIEKGFICEPYAIDMAIDVTDHGGWRAYLRER